MNSVNPMLANKKTSKMIRCNLSLGDVSSYSVVVSVVTTVCTTLPWSFIFKKRKKL